MKKGLIVLIVVAGIALALFAWVKGAYNSMVTAEENVSSAWSQVENVYQRRADLIPNLVSTVKGYAAHESSTLEGVVEARSKATQMSVNIDDLNEESLKKYQEAQGSLGMALSRLLSITENYPDLKANKNFLALQSQLEGTENRIAVERNKFNEVAKVYNTKIRRFPNNILAGMFGFEKKPYFTASEGADKVPEVNFQ